jgi:hypothetical protein
MGAGYDCGGRSFYLVIALVYCCAFFVAQSEKELTNNQDHAIIEHDY